MLRYQHRVFRSDSPSGSVALALSAPNERSRTGPYKLYNIDSLQKAISMVEKGQCSIRRAATLCGVPPSTLHDHISGKVQAGAKPGPDPYLNLAEEEELVSFLLHCADIGYPYTRKQVLALAQEILTKKKISTTLSAGWWDRFRQHHPRLCLRVAAPLSYARAMATDRESLNWYFDVLEKTLRDNGIFNNPSAIFNCDETGLPFNPKSHKVISEVGSKNPVYPTGNSKGQVTVLACTCAAGYALPPFVVFPRKSLNLELTRGEVPGTKYGLSKSGWMTRTLFSAWFSEHFLPNAPSSRPLILLLDGHSSHYCPEIIKKAASEQILIYALPPNTTHLTQPLDKGCFGPLKSCWRQTVQGFVAKNHGQTVTIYDFSALFADAWFKGMSMSNVLAGFKVTGIYPFNRDALGIPEEQYECFKPEIFVKESGLKYILLYSPMPHACDAVRNSKSLHSTPKSLELSSVHYADSSLEHSFSESSIVSATKQLQRSYSDSCLDVSRADAEDTSNMDSCFMPMRTATSLRSILKSSLPKKPTRAKAVSTGHLLTSASCIKALEEKERKKQLAMEEKEERKKIRDEKRKAKEEAVKSKGIVQSTVLFTMYL